MGWLVALTWPSWWSCGIFDKGVVDVLPVAVQVASLASLWVAWQGNLGVSANSRGGARSGVGDMGQATVGYDVDAGVGLGLALRESRFNLSLGYGPSFTVRDVNGRDRALLVMHGGSLNLGFGGRGYALGLSQSLSVGTTSFRGLRTTPVDPMAMPNPTMPRVDLVPTVETAKVFNSSTNANFNYQWDPRLSSGAGAAYSISGGSGAAQTAYPQVRTAMGSLSTGYLMSGRDTFGLQAAFARITTKGGTSMTAPMGPLVMSPDFLYWTLTSGLDWSHKFSTTTRGSLSGGAFGYSTTTPGHTPLYSLALTAAGTIDTQLMRVAGFTINGGVGTGVAPAVNQLNGTMQQRVQGTGRVSATMARFSINASADGAQSFPTGDPNAIRLLGVGAGLGYSPAQFVDLSADYRSTWQTSGAASIPRLWVVFVGIGVRAPPLRF
jgi:hypothetical protein